MIFPISWTTNEFKGPLQEYVAKVVIPDLFDGDYINFIINNHDLKREWLRYFMNTFDFDD